MTLCALLLGRRFYDLRPSPTLAYATLGLLFVNVSVGGVLTNFAAPPVLMVASTWNWSSAFMFWHFGDKAVVGIVLSNALYYFWFRKEFAEMAARGKQAEAAPLPAEAADPAFPTPPPTPRPRNAGSGAAIRCRCR